MNEVNKAKMRSRLGNISQLQELLFGEQTKEYNQKLEAYHHRLNHLESNYQKLYSIIDERLKKLENKLVNQLNLATNSLEKKINYLNLANKAEQQKLQKDFKLILQQTHRTVNHLQDTIQIQNNSLKAEIAQSQVTVNEEIKLLKQQITEKLNSSLFELANSKVSRNDLAQFFSELGSQLKDPNPNLKSIQPQQSKNDIEL